MPFYMTGTTTCRNRQNADDNVARFGKPAVIRIEGKFHIVTRLSERPIQPGQVEFKLREGETIYNWAPSDG